MIKLNKPNWKSIVIITFTVLISLFTLIALRDESISLYNNQFIPRQIFYIILGVLTIIIVATFLDISQIRNYKLGVFNFSIFILFSVLFLFSISTNHFINDFIYIFGISFKYSTLIFICSIISFSHILLNLKSKSKLRVRFKISILLNSIPIVVSIYLIIRSILKFITNNLTNNEFKYSYLDFLDFNKYFISILAENSILLVILLLIITLLFIVFIFILGFRTNLLLRKIAIYGIGLLIIIPVIGNIISTLGLFNLSFDINYPLLSYGISTNLFYYFIIGFLCALISKDSFIIKFNNENNSKKSSS